MSVGQTWFISDGGVTFDGNVARNDKQAIG